MKGIIAGGTVLTALLAVGAAKLVLHYNKKRKEKQKYEKLVPKIVVEGNGNVNSIERFGDYVVRQMGLDPATAAAKHLVRVAEDYLRGDKSRSDDSLENVFVFLTRACPQVADDDQIKELNLKFVQELDVCIVTYFSFHWKHTAKVIDQVVNGGLVKRRSLKRAVLSATRKLRFQKVMKELKTKRIFTNMLEMMRAIGKHSPLTPDQQNVVVPAHASVRSPVLMLLGGGMGAGKSTVVKDVMEGPFWKSVSSEAVVVEADAFKENDVIYRALSSIGHGESISEAAELVHESSTNAASALLVTALNEGRDVILDGTMSWEPFVLQTIAMARDVHKKQYRMGPGYVQNEDGTVLENYWEKVEDCEEFEEGSGSRDSPKPAENGDIAIPQNCLMEAADTHRKPYRIEFVGVVCDAHMAVVRGMRRAIITKRGVPVRGQLRSHKLFSLSLEKYCDLMDYVKIYSTSAMGGPAELIALKDGVARKLLKDCDEFTLVQDLLRLNQDATSVLELYNTCNDTFSHKKWQDFVLAPDRHERQVRLMKALNCAELHHALSELDLTSLVGSPAESPINSAGSSSVQRSDSNHSNDSSSPDSDNCNPGPADGSDE